MKKRIKDLADQGVPDFKDDIKSSDTYLTFMAERQNETRSWRINPNKAFTGLAAAMVILLAFILFPTQETSTQSSTLYFEINPSFMIELDDSDTVSDVDGLNADGNAIIDTSMIGTPFEDAMDTLIDNALDNDLIDAERSDLLYDVLSENDELKDRHLALVESKLSDIQESKLPSMTMHRGIGGAPTEAEQEIVETYDIGLMHARLIGRIMSEDETKTIEDLVDKSMPELMNELDEGMMPGQNDGPRHPFDDEDFPPHGPHNGGTPHE